MVNGELKLFRVNQQVELRPPSHPDPGPVRVSTRYSVKTNDVYNIHNVPSYESNSSSEFNSSFLNSFNCYYTNAQSIYHKFDELVDIVLEGKKNSSNWNNSDMVEINLESSEIFRCDRQMRTGGGALMYINESSKSSAYNELDNYKFEDAVWRKVDQIINKFVDWSGIQKYF